MSENFSVPQMVADRIIAELEKGEIPWRKPWVCRGAAINYVTRKPYSLLNQMLVGKPGEYLSFKQATERGGKIRKGAKSRIVVFWKPMEKKTGEVDPDGVEIEKTIFLLRYYRVFHIDDVEGVESKLEPDPNPEFQPDEHAENIMADYTSRENIRLEITDSDRAYYSPMADMIVLPNREKFREVAEFYSTAFHEMTHSTGHAKRLARITEPAAFGSESYSKEELVAEIGAATLCHECNLETTESFRNSAAYVQGWLKALKDDPKMIISAASKAEKAVDFIIGEKSGAET